MGHRNDPVGPPRLGHCLPENFFQFGCLPVAIPPYDQEVYNLPIEPILSPYCRRIDYCPMVLSSLLNVFRNDSLSSLDDHVLLAATNSEKPILIELPQVASADPSIAYRQPVPSGASKVTLHIVRSLDPDLTTMSMRECLTVFITYFNPVARQRFSDGPPSLRGRRLDGGYASRLGKAIFLQYSHIKFLLEPPQSVRRNRGSTANHVFQGRCFRFYTRWQRQKSHDHRGHQIDVFNLILRDCLPKPGQGSQAIRSATVDGRPRE